MTVHNPHSDSKPGTILHDGCPRCQEHANEPFAGLDKDNLAALAKRAMSDDDDVVWATSELDVIAIREIQSVIHKSKKLEKALANPI
jgi:hypothetical protein